MTKNIDITDKQKHILIAAGAIIITVFLFVRFLYMPLAKSKRDLKAEYDAITDKISEFKSSIGQDKPLEKVIISLKGNLAVLNNKLPDKEEAILREISTLADKLKIEMTSIKPDKKRPVQNPPAAIGGCAIQEMPVSLNLKTSYKTMGEFLKTLRDSFPVPVTIESVSMARSGGAENSNLLDANVSLMTYLVVAER